MDASSRLLGRLWTVKSAVKQYFEGAAYRRQLREELACFAADDLDRVLADIGLGRNEMKAMIANAPRSHRLMRSMLRRLGLENRLALMPVELVRSIERRCAACANQPECDDWMSKGAPGDGYRHFCPNAAAFDALPRGSRMV